ncbi:ankyrin repeat-containing protein ITN1-like [Chenopodium quinoa]|uniref:ankyrin repeat-containing protein ITN1-like n=1 Tax=Chenopodium quinoa TaxID=63459 RepID=UPI000B78EA52|nr:ankyrin repeat-containing protein ITN1-like [Chenopodium quinoa]
MIMAVDELQTKLYRALCNNHNKDEVIELCKKTPDHSLHYCTINNSTVLHLACYSKKFELANELFDGLPKNSLNVLVERTNAWGDTILHDASTSNQGLELVRKMLHKVPELIQARNKWGESCIFRATRYGRRKIFEYLAEEVDKFCELNKEFTHLYFFQRDDGTTILHMAILTRNFDMALMIARKYPYLCGIRAQNMTALQILACTPAAFKSGTEFGLIKELLYSSVSIDEQSTIEEANIILKAFGYTLSIGKSCWILPMIEEIKEVKRGHKDALDLAKILIQHDTSWKDTHEPRAEVTPVIMGVIPIIDDESREDDQQHDQYFDIERGETIYRGGVSDSDEAPLLLAARKGCIEIVEEILDMYPQAVNYINHNQENVLHVAVKSRNMSIFKLVEQQVSPHRGLLGAVDNKNNSILHMVGCPRDVLPGTKMKSPVLQLSDDLLLLEYLENTCPSYLVNHRNDQMMTADELFALNNEKLRIEAKDWLKRTAEHNTVVIILIATVAFAAAYAIPGGPNQTTGYPLLIGLPFFLVFTVTDVLSLGFALTAVIVFLAILTSSYQLKDFRRSLPQKLLLGFTLLFLSVTMMMVAFAATILLMVNTKERWTKTALYIVAFFPICIFMLSYIPLYIKLVKTLNYWVKKIGKSLPRFACVSRPARRTSFRRA